MKRYSLFLGAQYYPSPGMGDFIYDTEFLDEIKDLVLDFYKNRYNEKLFTIEKSFTEYFKYIKLTDYIVVFDNETKQEVISEFHQVEGL